MFVPQIRLAWRTLLVLAASVTIVLADEPVTLDNVKDPGPIKPDEPIAQSFSLERALSYLDTASVHWQKQHQCFTCHTNYSYLIAAPALGPDRPARATVRQFAELLVSQRWEEKGPRWPAEVVMTAAVLATGDAARGKLHPLTRKALDHMWAVQRADGGWDWLKCNWPPMESDDHYGVTMALLAVGLAPEKYAETEAAKAGLENIRKYLAANPPPTLHHRAMIFWASRYIKGLMSEAEQKAMVDELLVLQRDDGGWGLATLGNWKRGDGSDQDTKSSDGYGTGFVIFMARLGGVPAADPRLQRGIAWLKTNQRESGRWFTRSLNKDSRHLITNAGSAFAVMALHASSEMATAQAAGASAHSGGGQ